MSAGLFAFAWFAAGRVGNGLVLLSAAGSLVFLLSAIGVAHPRTAWRLAEWIFQLGEFLVP